jgi:phage protein D
MSNYYEKQEAERRELVRQRAAEQAQYAQQQAEQQRLAREEQAKTARANRAAAVSEAESLRNEARELRERAARLKAKAEERLRFSGSSEEFEAAWTSHEVQAKEQGQKQVDTQKREALRRWDDQVGRFSL